MQQFLERCRVLCATTKPTSRTEVAAYERRYHRKEKGLATLLDQKIISIDEREIRNYLDQMVKKSVKNIAEALWEKPIRNRN